MAKNKRPTVVLVIAIFHFLGAGLGFCGMIGQVAGPALQQLQAGQNPRQAEMQKRLEEKMAERIPAYSVVQYAEIGANLVFTVLLIIAGVGLLNVQPYGRQLSLLYAVLAIVIRLASLVFGVLFIVPAVDDIVNVIMQEVPPQDQNTLQPMMGILKGIMVAAMIGGPLAAMIYPAVVLVVMLLPGVKAAFARRGGDLEREDEYEEGDDWGYRRGDDEDEDDADDDRER